MAIHDLTRASLEYHKGQIFRLTPDTPRKWGKMDVTKMLCHVRVVIEMSLAERECEDKSIPILRKVIKFLVFDTFTTWPKGRIKVPDSLTPETSKSFGEEKDALIAALERFIDQAEKDPNRKGISPVLGPVPLSYWSHIHGVHLNHHFRQFGLI